MMRLRNIVLMVLAAVVLLTGCNKELLTPPEAPPAERVLLMYDNIDDAQTKPFTGNVKAAGKAVAAGALGAGERVIVFHRRYRVDGQTGDRSVIYELVKDSSQDDGFRREMLKVYESGVNATLSKEVLANVVNDIRAAAPAPHYGFVFGSHGMGWIPKSNTVGIARKGGGSKLATSEHPFAVLWEVPENQLTRFFRGYGKNLDVSEFINALDEWSWDFILLDDCFMASVEALYDMRTLANYIIASPTEIMIDGFPYDRVVSILFQGWANDLERHLANVADAFVEAYREGSMHSIRSATIAVVKTSELDALAESVRRMSLKLNELTSVDGIQYYERLVRPGHIFYDLDDYVSRIRATTTPNEYNAFKQQLARTVIYAGHTDTFYSEVGNYLDGKFIPVNSFSGLNIFIPWQETVSFIPAYQQTAWYKYVYGE